MTDIFISYKREDQQRVAPLAEALLKRGFDVWWDRHIGGGASWRQSIIEQLAAAKCVIVVWSEASVSAAADFVHDEAGRAKARGVLLPVKIDRVDPPVGFGEVQALDLVGWRGGGGDPRFQDVAAAARAIVEGGPRPRPKAPGRRVRLAAMSGAAFAAVAAAVGFLGDIAGLQAPICRAPLIRGVCAQQGWGGVASAAEQAAWDARAPGDCESLRAFLAEHPNGAYAEEAARRLQAASASVDEQWAAETRRLPLTVRSGLAPLSSEAAARRDALSRSAEDVDMVCGPFAQLDGYRLTSARAEPRRWRCTALGDGALCGFDGEAVCDIEVRTRSQVQTCR